MWIVLFLCLWTPLHVTINNLIFPDFPGLVLQSSIESFGDFVFRPLAWVHTCSFGCSFRVKAGSKYKREEKYYGRTLILLYPLYSNCMCESRLKGFSGNGLIVVSCN